MSAGTGTTDKRTESKINCNKKTPHQKTTKKRRAGLKIQLDESRDDCEKFDE